MLVKASRRTILSRDNGNLLMEMLQSEIGPKATVLLQKEKPWASITFSGTRYRFRITVPTGSPENLAELQIARLIDHEFDLAGHFVADFLLHEKRPEEAFFTIEILTIADPVSEKKESAIC